jgi:hypothetical protein
MRVGNEGSSSIKQTVSAHAIAHAIAHMQSLPPVPAVRRSPQYVRAFTAPNELLKHHALISSSVLLYLFLCVALYSAQALPNELPALRSSSLVRVCLRSRYRMWLLRGRGGCWSAGGGSTDGASRVCRHQLRLLSCRLLCVSHARELAAGAVS